MQGSRARGKRKRSTEWNGAGRSADQQQQLVAQLDEDPDKQENNSKEVGGGGKQAEAPVAKMERETCANTCSRKEDEGAESAACACVGTEARRQRQHNETRYHGL